MSIHVSLSPRRLLFWIHIWIGLAFCLPFALLGITGSILVYEQPINALLAPIPAATAAGTIASPQAIIDAAVNTRSDLAATSLSLPQASGEPAVVRLTLRGAGRGARGPNYQAFVDPVSLQVLDVREGARSAFMGWVHDFHGSLLLGGPTGRPLIGWMGVGMLALGLSGIVLWWPKQNRWRDAYGIKKGARGWLFHRQLHGTVGITAWLLFIVLSFSGIAIAFPQTTGALVRGALLEGTSQMAPATGPGAQGVRVKRVDGVQRIDASRALAVATAAAPNARLVTMFLPNGREQPFRLFLLPESAAQGSPMTTVLVDPYRAEAINVRDPWAGDLGDVVMNWQRPLHTGRGTNDIYRAAIFLVGLLPLLFAVTGVAMWWNKRRTRAVVSSRGHKVPQGVAAE
ncbi:MAG TPA: PepSY-associated TM helix domain-containing protein [Micropepsaceae bacterium]|jgi:uncharacterized iron-regulated membrane protein|nr:PepSY-associated TM helix domain-containing protein [Micropepsaceae bacterium]